MTQESATELLALHAVRLRGFANTARLAERFGISVEEMNEHLLDFQAFGWVSRSSFGETEGWSLTAAGIRENEAKLAAELLLTDAAQTSINRAHARFLPLNRLVLGACTDWQLRPTEADSFAANDHTDSDWDARIFEKLTSASHDLDSLNNELVAVLARFTGYATRFRRALERARTGGHAWVNGTGIDSCHSVWFELHEDLIATLGITR